MPSFLRTVLMPSHPNGSDTWVWRLSHPKAACSLSLTLSDSLSLSLARSPQGLKETQTQPPCRHGTCIEEASPPNIPQQLSYFGFVQTSGVIRSPSGGLQGVPWWGGGGFFSLTLYNQGFMGVCGPKPQSVLEPIDPIASSCWGENDGVWGIHENSWVSSNR